LIAYARPIETPNEYIVGVVRVVDGKTITEKEYKVESDPSNKMVFYRCWQLKRIRILCSHTLKVLDMMNMNILHERYILKR
jgi:endonuclease YncB( thermonuclease family)